MIRITDSRTVHYVAPDNIARLTEAATSSQWHGIRTIVKLFDGSTIEAQEPIETIRKLVEDHNKDAK